MTASNLRMALAGGVLVLTCGALLVSVLRSGSMRLRGGGRLRRKDHPTAFWIHVAVLVGFCALGGGMIVWSLVDLARYN